MASFWPVESGFDVLPLQEQLARHPELWNEHRARTQMYAHDEISDIWVRYRRFEDFNGDLAEFNQPHVATWYDCIHKIPAAAMIARRLKNRVGAKTLGGVLLTRIPPGGMVKPHIDGGWHASHYRKYCVSIKADEQQAFCFDDAEHRTVDGDVFEFRNDVTHWVKNDSDRERISLIVCVR